MSNRERYADKVAKEIPSYMGRDTKMMSNNQLKSIGRVRGISR